MQVETTDIPGVLIITPRRFGDARGFFAETYNAKALAAQGVETAFVQDNHSLSETEGTVRGLHFQAPPHAHKEGAHFAFQVVLKAEPGVAMQVQLLWGTRSQSC